MALTADPEGNETRALEQMIDFKGLNVLEIGCGDGRLTWRYATQAAFVTAIDPRPDEIELARAALPAALRGHVDLQATGFDEFAAARADASFDTVILSWSLC